MVGRRGSSGCVLLLLVLEPVLDRLAGVEDAASDLEVLGCSAVASHLAHRLDRDADSFREVLFPFEVCFAHVPISSGYCWKIKAVWRNVACDVRAAARSSFLNWRVMVGEMITYQGGERALASRIAAARADRGWSLERLSDELAKVGCVLGPTSIQKLEKGKKPRKITVDELIAFSTVFQIPVEKLLRAPGREVSTATMHALGGAHSAWVELAGAAEAYLLLEEELVDALVGAVHALQLESAPQRSIAAVVGFVFREQSVIDYLLRESRPAARKRREAGGLPIPDFKARRPWEGK